MVVSNNYSVRVYPLEDDFFLDGLTKLTNEIECRLYIPLASVQSDFVFIDLSLYNVHHLVDYEAEWIDALQGKKIVFVVAKNLWALANTTGFSLIIYLGLYIWSR